MTLSAVLLHRRLLCWLAGVLICAVASPASAADAGWPAEITIGYQKYGTLIILKSHGDLEKRLAPHGVTVKWAEFAYGGPLLEALNAGRVQFGISGETPPVVAQAAAGSKLRYVAFEPAAPRGEAIVVAKDSPLKSVADLKGKKVALAKGANVHYFLIAALAKAGLTLSDIQPVYLLPGDARPAFARGDVDAWAIWDYHFAAVQESLGARVLVDAQDTAANHAFFLAPDDFVANYPDALHAVLDEVAKIDTWTQAHKEEASALLAEQVGSQPQIIRRALDRAGYGPEPLTADVVAAQQKIADSLLAEHLIPHAITVSEVVWPPVSR